VFLNAVYAAGGRGMQNHCAIAKLSAEDVVYYNRHR
jgi:hypothetical protein